MLFHNGPWNFHGRVDEWWWRAWVEMINQMQKGKDISNKKLYLSHHSFPTWTHLNCSLLVHLKKNCWPIILWQFTTNPMLGIRGQKLRHAYQIHHGIWLSVDSKIAISSNTQNDWVLSAQHTSFSGQLPGSQETNCVELPLKTLNRICKPYMILSLTSAAKETFSMDYLYKSMFDVEYYHALAV